MSMACTSPRALHNVTALLLAALAATGALAGTVEHHEFPSATLDRPYAYEIYLPDDYAESELHYPVLYLLHGSGGSETDWVKKGDLVTTADRLIDEGAVPPAIVVMPGGRSWWIDGHNEAGETAFLEDLMPEVAARWRTLGTRDGRLIAGLSAGGYGATNLALSHPERFAAAAALSPASYVPTPPPTSSAHRHPAFLDAEGRFDQALWKARNYPPRLQEYLAQDRIVPFWVMSGDHDTFDIAWHAAALYQALRDHQPGQVEPDRVEFRVVDGDHEWSVWAEALPEAVTWLFGHVQGPRATD
jgi:enterochelin esterase-like enzyme